MSDASASSIISQALADAFRVSTATDKVALWLLGLFVLVCFEAICVTRKIRLVDRLGYGYILGYFLSAWIMGALVTITIGAIAFVFIIIADATMVD
jgi:hypothetical protein